MKLSESRRSSSRRVVVLFFGGLDQRGRRVWQCSGLARCVEYFVVKAARRRLVLCVSSEDATRLLQLDASSSSSNAACCFYFFFFFLLPRRLDGSGRLSILGPRKRANFVLEPFFATKREWSCCGGDSSSAAFTKKSMYVTSKETHSTHTLLTATYFSTTLASSTN